MFDKVRLNLGYDYGVVGGPNFSTTIQETGDGTRLRHCPSYQSKGKWKLGDRQITQEDQQTLRDFFAARRGRSRGFLWKDWTDYRVTMHSQNGQCPGFTDPPTGSSTTTGFQLIKQYGALSRSSVGIIYGTYQRPIYAPIISTLRIFASIYNTNTIYELTPGTDWQCNESGYISIYYPLLEIYHVEFAATFEFDVPVRFDTDTFDANYVGKDTWRVSTLNVSELVFNPENAPSMITAIPGTFPAILPFWRFPRAAPHPGYYPSPWGKDGSVAYPSGGDIARWGTDRPSLMAGYYQSVTLLFDTFDAGYVPDSLDAIQFATQVSAITAGLESQQERYSNGKRQIQIGNRTLTQSELNILLSLFYGSRGGANVAKIKKNGEVLLGWFASSLNVSFLSETDIYLLESLWFEVN